MSGPWWRPSHLSLLALALVVVYAAEEVIEQARTCPERCTQNGNCNAETGKCNCNWGWEGEACEVDRLAACRQTPDDPGSCGYLWPKHCECFRACHNVHCPAPEILGDCTHELGASDHDVRCWIHADPNHAINSELPDDWNTSTIWYDRYTPEGSRASYDSNPDLRAPKEKWGMANWDGVQRAYPLSDCPNRCSNGRGVCMKWEHKAMQECVCHKGFNGTDCGTHDDTDACWFTTDCLGRGTCRSGFCHCKPGYFGMGCHRTTAFQPVTPGAVPDLRSHSKLKIYMYELPWTVAFPYDYNDGQFGRDPMYRAYEWFMMHFLRDNATRTENPYEANLFYVPMLLYFYIGNVRDPAPQAKWVIKHIQENYPFWNRSGGRDHFYFMTGDRGTCHASRWLQDSAIKLVHFGLQKRDMGWPDISNKEYGCIQVKRDLVVPPINQFLDILPTGAADYYQRIQQTGGRDENRTLLFGFAGGVGDGNIYSGGVRQALKRHLDALNATGALPPDVLFLEGRTPNYRQLLSTSKFCIAPYGYGWGLRLVQAVQFGCVPVIIQDWVYQPFEDFMPYEEFSVRLPASSIPSIVELLRGISDQELANMRLNLAKYYRAFIWEREYGGQAYEWTLSGLQRRLDNLRAEHIRRRHRHRRRDV
ncbi:hypothetical protein HYH03_007118 [Edaphochlamys debaryana]|uniref:EGF-like domain-containing protein n=1 Tax=Edaphochlamys debaryana TaxID=47281 RepID=A0A835Y474_9CHLO|nr:hypothetical protein HYH03_007118 [Edaphochlamys debaryana]|eukprot:KAG2494879.1 hypothetical protein HYH03_007118 [Edaphochlamys debaryana]